MLCLIGQPFNFDLKQHLHFSQYNHNEKIETMAKIYRSIDIQSDSKCLFHFLAWMRKSQKLTKFCPIFVQISSLKLVFFPNWCISSNKLKCLPNWCISSLKCLWTRFLWCRLEVDDMASLVSWELLSNQILIPNYLFCKSL